LNQQEFDESLKTGGLVLFDFYTDWCEPCKILDPILDEVKKRMGENFSIHKINSDHHSALAEQYHIKSVPTLMLFREGKLLWRMAGFDTADKLEKFIRQHSEN
jgi:thioredoxin 1